MEFSDQLALKCEVYDRLRIKSEQGNPFLVITEDRWQTLKQKWTYVTHQTRLWQWKLDSSLPGRVGEIGDWLYRAEDRLQTPHKYDADNPQNSVNMLMKQINEHKVIVMLVMLFFNK